MRLNKNENVLKITSVVVVVVVASAFAVEVVAWRGLCSWVLFFALSSCCLLLGHLVVWIYLLQNNSQLVKIYYIKKKKAVSAERKRELPK